MNTKDWNPWIKGGVWCLRLLPRRSGCRLAFWLTWNEKTTLRLHTGPTNKYLMSLTDPIACSIVICEPSTQSLLNLIGLCDNPRRDLVSQHSGTSSLLPLETGERIMSLCTTRSPIQWDKEIWIRMKKRNAHKKSTKKKKKDKRKKRVLRNGIFGRFSARWLSRCATREGNNLMTEYYE